jgi:phage antirepressor YoqD-like protein
MKLKDIEDLEYQGKLRDYISGTDAYMKHLKEYMDNFEVDDILEDFKYNYSSKKHISISAYIRSLKDVVEDYENIGGNKIHKILFDHGVTYLDETLNKKRIKQQFLDKGYFTESNFMPIKDKDAGIQTIRISITKEGQEWLLDRLKEFKYVK